MGEEYLERAGRAERRTENGVNAKRSRAGSVEPHPLLLTTQSRVVDSHGDVDDDGITTRLTNTS